MIRREARREARLEHAQDMLDERQLRLGIKDIELRYANLRIEVAGEKLKLAKYNIFLADLDK